jgi:hypothetical protein
MEQIKEALKRGVSPSQVAYIYGVSEAMAQQVQDLMATPPVEITTLSSTPIGELLHVLGSYLARPSLDGSMTRHMLRKELERKYLEAIKINQNLSESTKSNLT